MTDILRLTDEQMALGAIDHSNALEAAQHKAIELEQRLTDQLDSSTEQLRDKAKQQRTQAAWGLVQRLAGWKVDQQQQQERKQQQHVNELAKAAASVAKLQETLDTQRDAQQLSREKLVDKMTTLVIINEQLQVRTTEGLYEC